MIKNKYLLEDLRAEELAEVIVYLFINGGLDHDTRV